MAEIIEAAGGLAVVRTPDRGEYHVVRVYGEEEVQSVDGTAFADFSDAGVRYVDGKSYRRRGWASAALRRLAEQEGER